VDERVERRIADEVVGNVNKESFVRSNRRRKGMENVREGREGSVSKVIACDQS
jgi:hypothetical protein